MDKLKIFLQTLTQITDEEFEDSIKDFNKIHLKKGELLLQEGKVCKQMYFVNRGSLRTFYFNNNAEEITHCFRSENTFISSLRSFILQEPSFLSIMALEETELIAIDYDKVQELYSTSMAWQNIGRLLTEGAYMEMEEYASVLINESAKEKYLRLLEEQPEVVKKSNVQHIASYLGVTRRTLSRIKKEINE